MSEPITCVALISAGSDGDVLPLLRIGQALERTGRYHVALLAHERYRAWAKQHGWEFEALCSKEAYEEQLRDVRWLELRKEDFLEKYFLAWNTVVFRWLHQRRDRNTVIVSQPSLKIAADRIACTVLRMPLLSLRLEPPSTGVAMEADERKEASARKAVAYHQELTARLIRELRASFEVLVSPTTPRPPVLELQLGLWPDWFAPTGEASCRPIGFVDCRETALFETAPAVLADLRSAHPIVFMAGSLGTLDGWCERFFETSIEASVRLGLPCVLLGGERPASSSLADDVRWLPYAHLHSFLDSCTALVHHGGIGTAAAALTLGTPQIVAPRVFGQHANGARLKDLGVATLIDAASYQVAVLLPALENLIASKEIARRCSDVATRIARDDAVGVLVATVDQLGAHNADPAPTTS